MSRLQRQREPRRGPLAQPGDWARTLEQAARLARVACDAPEGGHDAGDLVQFRIRVRDLKAESFPSPAETSRLAAGAFLNAARMFAHPTAGPETRTACAALLGEATALCDTLQHAHRSALAEGTWARQFPGDA